MKTQMNGVALVLNMLGVLMGGPVVSKENGNFFVTMHRHGMVYQKTKLLKYYMCLKHLEGCTHHGVVFGFDLGEKILYCF